MSGCDDASNSPAKEAPSDRQGSDAAMVASIQAVAAHVVTGGATADVARASYDRCYVLVVPASRKAWGGLFRELENGWDDLTAMEGASRTTDALVAELIAAGEGVKKTVGSPIIVLASGLTLLAIVQHATRRRMRELRAAVADGAEAASGAPIADAP